MGVIWVFVIFMGLWANALDAYIFPDWFGGLAFGGTSVKQETESPSAGAEPVSWHESEQQSEMRLFGRILLWRWKRTSKSRDGEA